MISSIWGKNFDFFSNFCAHFVKHFRKFERRQFTDGFYALAFKIAFFNGQEISHLVGLCKRLHNDFNVYASTFTKAFLQKVNLAQIEW